VRICANPVCGNSLDHRRPQTRSCSGPCRAAASRAKKAATAAQTLDHPPLDQTARKRTHAATEVVAWDALSRAEQDHIEGILARHADRLADAA